MRPRHIGQFCRDGAQVLQQARWPQGKNTTLTSSSMQILHVRDSWSARFSSNTARVSEIINDNHIDNNNIISFSVVILPSFVSIPSLSYLDCLALLSTLFCICVLIASTLWLGLLVLWPYCDNSNSQLVVYTFVKFFFQFYTVLFYVLLSFL